MAREVVEPSGRRWRVRRRWLVAPVRPHWRGTDNGWLDATPDLGVSADDGGVLGVIAVVVVIVFLAALVAFVLVPLAILLLEILLFVVLARASAGRSPAGARAPRRWRPSPPRWSGARGPGHRCRPRSSRGAKRPRGHGRT